MYELLYRRVLQHIPAETAHRLAFAAIRFAGAVPGLGAGMRRVLGPTDPVLRVRALGMDLPGPLGLAAGFDKDAEGVDGLTALGFAYVEVGTITAQAQPGNPRPRMFRLPADRALVNRMGFNNHGAAAAADRLRRRVEGGQARGRTAYVGVNIGKTKVVPEAGAVGDYVASARRLAPYADYLVVNVSSPNTPGLRDLQAVERLRPLLAAVRQTLDEPARTERVDHRDRADHARPPTARRVPLLVKIAPDLSDADVDAVADLALDLGLDGIIATNTTIGRDGLRTDAGEVAELGAGGLSGAPLKARALEVIRRLHARVGDRLVLVAAGGIENADDAWERIRAGATLVQAYTGFIYGGPAWPRKVHRGIARRARAAGYGSVAEAVGTSGRPGPGGTPLSRSGRE
ncbi:quinone-dependent dihydroorotate dehydrogenase [Actinopolymorpha singaporensis]|uniref:Dihydroorotate dehydrogenase (quinone) n=1 Tax=Actinopolymorpha singaporensis TaxID=117157 RepID=A0A1H1WCZ2_9ACTN|nr:quinone-dependent dihydroorotate dehydrogenase [Actinopolymorpha singaporensis]SDS94852.1 dihydroorotate oxidase A [Actinopolymorpha singaporensis]